MRLASVPLLCLFGLQTVDPSGVTIDVLARALTPGELVVVDVGAPADVSALHVAAFGQTATAFRDGSGRWRALVGIDLDQPPGPYTIFARADTPGGPATARKAVIVDARRFPTRTLRVPPDFVNPPPAVQKRIEREALWLREAFAAGSRERLWVGPFVRPVPHESNSRFGTRSVFNGEPRNPHTGADFLSPAGTPVRAPNAGRVIGARDLFFSGRTVIIDHGLGLFSQLAHLSRIDVKEGESVEAGRVVGLVGATGRVTGPHLHWGLRAGTARVDPLSLLSVLGVEDR
jgi:murein DD-endopeptidase MepM/ murein hydrolase activator NlpD